MNVSEKKLNKLKEFTELLQESLTREEFLEAFKKVMEIILRVEKKNSEAIETLEKNYISLIEKTKGDHSSTLADLRSKVDSVFVGERLSIIDRRQNEKLSELEKKVNEKIKLVRDGRDGIGIKGDKGEMGLKGEIDFETLKELKKEIEELEKKIGRRPLFGGSAPRTRIIYGEVPSGTINGVNKTFTLTKAPLGLALFRGGARQKVGATKDYTISSKTITFDTAPVVGEELYCDLNY